MRLGKNIRISYQIITNIEIDKIEEGSLLNATNTSLDPFDYHLGNCDSFKTLENSQIYRFYLDCEQDGEDEVRMKMMFWLKRWRIRLRQIIVMGTMKWLKFLIKSVLYVTEVIVFMLLDNAVISVFLKTVNKTEVILTH